MNKFINRAALGVSFALFAGMAAGEGRAHSSVCFVSSQARIAQPAFCPRISPIGGI